MHQEIEWTEKKIEQAIEALENNSLVKYAINELVENYGFPNQLNTRKLRGALKRAGKETPSYYLSEEEQSQPLEIDRNAEKELNEIIAEDHEKEDQIQLSSSNNSWAIDRESQKYTFIYENSKVELTFDEMEKAFLLYSDHPPGKGKTGFETASALIEETGKEWITGDFLRWMFRSFNYNKSLFPKAPHQQFEDEEQMVSHMTKKSELLNKDKIKQETLKSLQKRLDKKEEKIDELKDTLGFHNSLPKTIDKSGDDKLFRKPEDGILKVWIPDMHAGKKELERKFGKTPNYYNQEEFHNRIDIIVSLIDKQLKRLGDNIKKCYLFGLGDDFESLFENIQDQMHRRMYGDPQTNWQDTVTAFTRIYKKLLESGVDVEGIHIGGNHDRVKHDKVSRTERILNFLLVDRLKSEFEEEDMLDIKQGRAVTSIVLENNVNCIFKHGHLKNISKTKWSSFKDTHGYKTADRYLTAQGHMHTMEISDQGNGLHFQMPSIVGADVYSTDFLDQMNRPRFLMTFSTQYEDQILGPYDILSRSPNSDKVDA